jgi:hypothetical protein
MLMNAWQQNFKLGVGRTDAVVAVTGSFYLVDHELRGTGFGTSHAAAVHICSRHCLSSCKRQWHRYGANAANPSNDAHTVLKKHFLGDSPRCNAADGLARARAPAAAAAVHAILHLVREISMGWARRVLH